MLKVARCKHTHCDYVAIPSITSRPTHSNASIQALAEMSSNSGARSKVLNLQR